MSVDRQTAAAPSAEGASSGALRSTVAEACRVLADRGILSGVLGHVSARTPEGDVLVRCRSAAERGVRWTGADAVRLVDLDGRHVETSTGWEVPNELPIHLALYRTRPEVGAVVHAHPRSALLCGLAELEPRPVFGAYNIPALELARRGIPVYPRSVLLTRTELAAEMATAMAGSSVCILRGHGIVAVGRTVEEATLTAIDLDELLSVTVALAQLGASPAPVPDADLAELPDLGPRFNQVLRWQAVSFEVADRRGESRRSDGRRE